MLDLASVMSASTAPAETFGQRIAAAQKSLTDSLGKSGLRTDPYAVVVHSLSAALGTLPDFIAEVQEARQPWEAGERQAVMREAAADLKEEIKWIVREQTKNRTVAAGIIAAAMLIVGIVGGYIIGRTGNADEIAAVQRRSIQIQGDMQNAVAPLTHDQVMNWSWLLTLNPDPRSAQANCTADSNSRRFCWFKLWVDQAAPPPSSAAPPTDALRR